MYTLLAQINIFLLLLLGDKRYLELQVLKQKIMKKLRIYPDADNPYWQKMIKRYKGLEGKIPLPLGIGGGSILLANGSSLLYDALYGGAIRNYNKFGTAYKAVEDLSKNANESLNEALNNIWSGQGLEVQVPQIKMPEIDLTNPINAILKAVYEGLGAIFKAFIDGISFVITAFFTGLGNFIRTIWLGLSWLLLEFLKVIITPYKILCDALPMFGVFAPIVGVAVGVVSFIIGIVLILASTRILTIVA